MDAIPRIGFVVLAACLTAPLATAQGKGNGNGGGGGGGGGSSPLYEPVLLINGPRRDLDNTVSNPTDPQTGYFYQPQQIKPADGKSRAALYSISIRGDFSMRQPDGTRYVLDVRVSDSAPWAMVCMPETAGTYANPTWWYVAAEDDGVDTVLAPDLTGWTIFRAKWSNDLEWVAVQGTNPSGVSGIFLWDVILASGVPASAIVDTLPYVENAVSPTWGAGQRMAFITENDGNGFGELYVAQNLVAKTFVLITEEIGRVNGGGDVGAFWERGAISPDGTQVAYVKLTGSDRTDLFVLPADGSGSEASALQVTNASRVKPKGFWTQKKNDTPVWSQTGTQLAFAVRANQSSTVISTWRIEVQGTSAAKKLTSDIKFNGDLTGRAHPVAWRD